MVYKNFCWFTIMLLFMDKFWLLMGILTISENFCILDLAHLFLDFFVGFQNFCWFGKLIMVSGNYSWMNNFCMLKILVGFKNICWFFKNFGVCKVLLVMLTVDLKFFSVLENFAGFEYFYLLPQPFCFPKYILLFETFCCVGQRSLENFWWFCKLLLLCENSWPLTKLLLFIKNLFAFWIICWFS